MTDESFSHQRPDEFFQSVRLHFVHQLQLGTDFPRREALLRVPGKIWLGQFNEQAAFVAAVWHTGVGKLDELLAVGCGRLHFS